MSLKIFEYANTSTQAEELAHTVAEQLSGAIDQKGKATLAVPGGTTPSVFLTQLSQESLDWFKVTVTLTDERWVPLDSERSNFALLLRTLAKNKAASANFIPLYRPTQAPENALSELENELTPHLPIDVCVVGMGNDMHTASLFPKAEGLECALDVNAETILAPIRPCDTDETRITLTASALNKASFHHVLIKGEDKLKTLEQAKTTTSIRAAPIRLILNQPSTSIHYAA